MKYKLVLFDLDGTLLDTSLGIFNSVRFAEQKMGFTPVDDDRLREFVGPPPKEMYKKVYGVSDEIALIATQYHREYGVTRAIFEATLYPGMISLLQILKKENIKVGVATLKAQHIAEKVLDVAQIHDLLDVIVGMDASESLTKADTIRIAMEKLSVKDDVVLVGDSFYDLEGAKECGVDFIGVKYGFGFSEKVDIPYGVLVDTVEKLKKFL